ncbi:MAG: hypothetical protein H0V92_04785 [Pseudonocardiales bacterium]|nr:hypothetical protein [Pseudonocardiales bacterium]
MTADQSPDPGRQRTVAELLEQYGETRGSGSRRRRRAADEESDDAPVGGQPDAAPPSPPPSPPSVPERRWATGTGYSQSVDPLTGEPINSINQSAAAESTAAPSTSYRGLPTHRTDPPTEQLPRYPEPARGGSDRTGFDRGAGQMTGPLTGPMSWPGGSSLSTPGIATPLDDGPPTGQVSREDLFTDDDDDGPPDRGGSAAPAGLAERDDRGGFVDDDDLDDDDLDDDDLDVEKAPRLGVKGWVGLIVQWVIGVIVGALLWVGFYYLWTHYPVIAPVAAFVATGGLVLLVRAIRRSDDLQTTMLAVLVGLIVTMTPAVLLLASR